MFSLYNSLMSNKEFSNHLLSKDYIINIIESILDCLIVINSDATIKALNKATCDLLGYKKDELIEKDVNLLFFEENRTFKKTTLYELIKKKSIVNYEVNFKTKDNNKIPMLLSCSVMKKSNCLYNGLVSDCPEYKKNGKNCEKFQGIVIVAKDITKRKRMEERITYFSSIFENSLNEIYLFKADTLKYYQVNSAAQQNIGYTMEELQKLTPLDLQPEFTKDSFSKLIAPLIIGVKNKIIFNSVHKRKNKSIYNAEVHLQFLNFEKKEIFSAIILDITERKQAEEKYRTLFNTLQDAIMIISPPNWNYIDANPTTLKIFGAKDIDEFTSLFPWNVSPKYQPDGQLSSVLAKEKIMNAMKTGSNFFEWTHKRLNGEEFPTAVLLSKVWIEGKEVLQVTIKDITIQKNEEKKKKLLEQELNQALKLESIGTLSAGIAHEINTPIQFISNNTGFVQKAIDKVFILLKDYHDLLSHCEPGEKTDIAIEKGNKLEQKVKLTFLEKEIPLALSQSQEGINRVTKIVSAMKDFSHMGSEKMSHENINKAIESTITISRNEWKYIAQMETDLDQSLPMVSCFIGDIKQVLLNLIVNAAHSIKDILENSKNKQGLITVSTYTKDKSVFITISDTGAGIPEKIRNNVFDHFFTTKEVGKGTGQGLSMAYQTIVEKHKGKISFETEIGKGTTFIIELPIGK